MRDKTRFPGQTLVEFAFVIPILLVLLLGFFDLGRAFFYNSSLSNAVREGVRAGIVMAYNEAAIKDKVLEYAFGLTSTTAPLTADSIVPEIINTGGSKDSLKVTATFCFVPVTPGITALIGSTCTDGNQGIGLTATSAMRIEVKLDE
jgi:Flp pilus assembly protein TadG